MSSSSFLLRVWGLHAKKGYYFCLSSKRDDRWRDHFFKWPISKEKINEFLERFTPEKYNLYFCPTPFNTPKRKKEYVVGSQYLWSDLDEAKPQDCKVVPNIAWESSPGRYAALWTINQFMAGKSVEEANKTLTYANGADRGGWDLSQVLRLPNTRNHKYPKSPPVKLLWYNGAKKFRLSRFEKLQKAQENLSPLEVRKKYRGKLPRKLMRLVFFTKPEVGKRSEMLWKLEADLREAGFKDDDIFHIIRSSPWNKFKDRRDGDEYLRREIDKIHNHTAPKSKRKRQRQDDDGESDNVSNNGPQLIRLDTVKPETVRWIWYPYIPRGKVSLLEGDPSLGKSWVTLALATHLSIRKRLPEQLKGRRGRVLFLSAEDGLGDTIRPRLDSLGADAGLVFAIKGAVTFDEDGMEVLEEYIREIKPTLIVIDPLVAYMGGQVDLHKANETREVMARLAMVAERHDTAILCVRHLTKGARDKSIYRGIGSIDLTAAARSVMMVGRDPDDDDTRAIAHIKSNLAPIGRTLRYKLVPGSKRPFRWGTACDLTAEEILKAERTGEGASEKTVAVGFLQETLKDGAVDRALIVREAEAKGISRSALNYAYNKLKAKTEKGKWLVR